MQNIEIVKEEYEKCIASSVVAFSDIEAKSRYWLSLTLPSFAGLLGVTISQPNLTDVFLQVSGAVCTCLFFAIWYFSQSLKIDLFSYGRIAPETKEDIPKMSYFLDGGKEELDEFKRAQSDELIRAYLVNKSSLDQKAKNLGFAESVLFVALPISSVLTVSVYGAFGDILANKVWPFTNVGLLGLAAGLFTVIFCLISHRVSPLIRFIFPFYTR